MVGILTFWGVPNYGAFAQAYALQRCISEIKSDENVVDIAYLHPEHQKIYFYRKKPALVDKSLKGFFNYLKETVAYCLKKRIEYPEFDKAWKSIPHIEYKNVRDLENASWTNVILGSDSIWEYSVHEFGDDEHLIGNRLNSPKIVSYAASFGDMTSSDQFPQFVVDGLNKLSYISVRDNSSFEIVKKLTGREADIVLDPTFLWKFDEDSNIVLPDESRYILVYGKVFPENLVKEVKDIARREELRIVGAGLYPDWVDEGLGNICPFEWIGRFAKATFVVTCTFHGLMFSIHFKRKSIFNQVEYVKNRSEWLIEQLELNNIYSDKRSAEEILLQEWNYDDITSKADKLIDQSKSVLKKMI